MVCVSENHSNEDIRKNCMKTFRPGKEGYIPVEKEGEKVWLMKHEVFSRFNPTLLDLGDITQPSQITNTICAVFDLEGFTNFCKQIDPQLSVPIYLSRFLDWIFAAIAAETVQEKMAAGVKLWHGLPFFTKFLGDGLLILWDISPMSSIAQHNLIISLDAICDRYLSEFLPEMKMKVSDPPSALRCGVTKGTVYSVGDGNDFIGPCINLAGRLQKLPGVKVAFASRGFDPESGWKKGEYIDKWILKKVAIRGMSNEELVYIRKMDFDKMSKDDQAFYHDPRD